MGPGAAMTPMNEILRKLRKLRKLTVTGATRAAPKKPSLCASRPCASRIGGVGGTLHLRRILFWSKPRRGVPENPLLRSGPRCGVAPLPQDYFLPTEQRA